MYQHCDVASKDIIKHKITFICSIRVKFKYLDSNNCNGNIKTILLYGLGQGVGRGVGLPTPRVDKLAAVYHT